MLRATSRLDAAYVPPEFHQPDADGYSYLANDSEYTCVDEEQGRPRCLYEYVPELDIYRKVGYYDTDDSAESDTRSDDSDSSPFA